MSTDDLGIESLDSDNIMSKEADRLNKDGGAMDNYVRLPEKDGFILLRFLPKLKNRKFFHPCRVHRLGEYPNSKTIFCTRQLVDTPRGEKWIATNPANDCPICVKYNALWEQTKKMSNKNEIEKIQNLARSIKPVERYYYNVIVRSQLNPKTNAVETNIGPKIFSCGKSVHTIIVQSINGSEISGRRKLGDIAHPTQGRDFRFVKQMKGGTYPNYDTSSFEDVSPLGTEEQIKSWIGNYHNLESIPVVMSVEDIRKILLNYLDGGVIVGDNQQQVAANKAASAPATAETVKKTAPVVSTEIDSQLDDADWQSALGAIGIK